MLDILTEYASLLPQYPRSTQGKNCIRQRACLSCHAARPHARYRSFAGAHELPFFPRTQAGSSNNTILPDEFLMSSTPIFLIRPPALHALMCSCSKGSDRLSLDGATLSWSRMLFDWYRKFDRPGTEKQPPKPIVIDATDFKTPSAFLRRLCVMTGLDPDKLTFGRDAASAGDLSTQSIPRKKMTGTMSGWTGVLAEKAGKDDSVANEVQNWRVECPKDISTWMEVALLREAEHYEYLRASRLLPDDALSRSKVHMCCRVLYSQVSKRSGIASVWRRDDDR